jgi:hypothetical protein
MFRNAGAIVAGVIVAFVTVMLIDMLGHMVFPPPEGLDFSDPEAIRPYLATLPFGAYFFILASSVVAAFVGTLLACYIGRGNPALFGGVVGGIVLAATIANFIAIPHPLWLSISTLASVVLSTLLAMRLAPNAGAESTEDAVSESDPG